MYIYIYICKYIHRNAIFIYVYQHSDSNLKIRLQIDVMHLADEDANMQDGKHDIRDKWWQRIAVMPN